MDRSATGTQRLLPASVRHSCIWLRIKAACSRGHRKQNRVASLSFTARRSELNRLSRGLRNAVHYLTRVVPLRLHHCHPSRATERLGSLTSQQPPHRGPVLMPGPMRTVMKPVHTQQVRRTRERLIRRRHIDLGRYRSALCPLP